MATGSDDLDFNAADYPATSFDKTLSTAKQQQQSIPINTDSCTEQSAVVSSTEGHCGAIDHTTVVHPQNIPQCTYLYGSVPAPRVFPSQPETTLTELESHSIHTEGIQDCEIDLSKQQLVVSARGDSVINSLKQAIQEKTDEIQQLKIDLRDSVHKAELREEQFQADIAKKDDDITSLKEYYEKIIADKDKELQKARDEAARMKKGNEELEKKLVDELTRIKNEYEEKLKELRSEKEVECLRLELEHVKETKQLELHIKDLERQLAEKNAEVEKKKATISELQKKQLGQQMGQQLAEQQKLIANLMEQLWQQSNPQQQMSSVASNEATMSARTQTLRSITETTANRTLYSSVSRLRPSLSAASNMTSTETILNSQLKPTFE